LDKAGYKVKNGLLVPQSERAFYSSLTYQEVLNFEMEASSTKVGHIKAAEVENYLAKTTNWLTIEQRQ